MLSQERRISQGFFNQILKEGRSFQTQNLSLRVVLRKDSLKSAFSFVVPAKIVKKAVLRNFLKRRGRYVVRKHLSKIKEGYFCAFFFKKEISKLPFLVFEQEILDSLKKAKLIE